MVTLPHFPSYPQIQAELNLLNKMKIPKDPRGRAGNPLLCKQELLEDQKYTAVAFSFHYVMPAHEEDVVSILASRKELLQGAQCKVFLPA